MIARARALLARYEALWRSRIARLDVLLAEPSPPVGKRPATTDPTSSQRTESQGD